MGLWALIFLTIGSLCGAYSVVAGADGALAHVSLFLALTFIALGLAAMILDRMR